MIIGSTDLVQGRARHLAPDTTLHFQYRFGGPILAERKRIVSRHSVHSVSCFV